MSQPSYIPGDFWRICDRCGFQMRASQSYKTWDGLFVCYEDFETRHPQDFVRGLKDNQNVPDPRPEPVMTVIGPLTTTLTAAATPGATSLTVKSSSRFESGDNIGIVCTNGTVRRQVDNVVSSTNITIMSALGDNAANGALIVNYSAVAEADVG